MTSRMQWWIICGLALINAILVSKIFNPFAKVTFTSQADVRAFTFLVQEFPEWDILYVSDAWFSEDCKHIKYVDRKTGEMHQVKAYYLKDSVYAVVESNNKPIIKKP